MSEKEVKEYVKKVYGEIATSEVSCCSERVCSCNCSSGSDVAEAVGYTKEELEKIPQDSIMGLGCGNPVAFASLKKGETVLDLGSGGGIDVFLAAIKVGDHGKAIGVDMTEEMVEKARALAVKNGYRNVEFRLGEIENLPIEDSSVDVIISNCVINLAPDKGKVFREAYRALKANGRIMVSDIVIEGQLPEAVRKSLDAWSGCVAGALEKGEYLKTIKNAGFENVRVISEKTYSIDTSGESDVKIMSIQVEALKN